MGLAEIISYNLTNLSSNIIKRGGFVYCSTMLCITLLWKDDIHMGKKANTNKFQINMKNIHLTMPFYFSACRRNLLRRLTQNWRLIELFVFISPFARVCFIGPRLDWLEFSCNKQIHKCYLCTKLQFLHNCCYIIDCTG